MNIVLIAQNEKKELMTDFCIAYGNILKNHTLFATGATGAIIEDATDLIVHKVSPGSTGGEQQIAARIGLNEIDLVIYFRDTINVQQNDPFRDSLLQLCDINNIPFATNIATAEMLVKGVERGDLEWRELVNPLYR
ncbi:MAG: methylglyoxal synthase [Acetivibrionales bacterium]|jgi:methylglyoxal synthase